MMNGGTRLRMRKFLESAENAPVNALKESAMKPFLIVATGSLALAGCGGSAPEPSASQASASGSTPSPVANGSAAPEQVPAPRPPAPPPAPVPPIAPPPPSPVPPPPPPLLTPEAAKGEKGARAVLLTWARALENHDFGLAWEQFRHPPAGRNGYVKWWSRYRTITVSLGTGSVEGGAGSLYYEVPVTMTGETIRGEPYRLRGTAVVRRVNDIDGASADQLRWHIDTANLEDAPPA